MNIHKLYIIFIVLFLLFQTLTSAQTAIMTSDTVLTEQRLDVRGLTIRLFDGEIFTNPSLLTTSDFMLVNAPPGMYFNKVIVVDSTLVLLFIVFQGPDFDEDYLDFYILISSSVLTINQNDLPTNTLPIFCHIENPSARLFPDSALTEYKLDQIFLKINLIDERFISGVNRHHFTILNYPTGLSISSATYLSSTSAILDLQFNGTDFDIDYPYFAVDINSSVLYSTESGYLRTESDTIFAYIEHPVATLTCDTTVLTEQRLDYRTLYIDFTEERFNNYTTIQTSDFTLLNGPPGLSIESGKGISQTKAEIKLQFYGDFDVTYPNFCVSMPEEILYQTTSGTLITDNLPISYYIETPLATVAPDSILEERTLDLRTLTINLTEEEFHRDSTLRPTNFILNNRPAGLTVGSVTRVTSRQALLDLEFDGTDFDIPISNFYVTIDKDVLLQSHSNLQTTNQLPIAAHVENPKCTISADTILTENLLNQQSIYLSLEDEHFINYTTLIPANFSLLNAPVGLSVKSAAGISPTAARLDFAFVYNDFDNDYTNFKVVIDKSILFYSKSSDLTSYNSLTITAHIEQPVADLSADSVLTEYRINERTLYIDLTEEAFRNYSSLLPANFTLANKPTGLTIQAARGISPTRAEIDLQFDGTDFDINYPAFAVDINYSVLVQTKSGALRTSADTIFTYIENPVATLSADSVLSELRLNWRTLIINLTEEKFKSYADLQPSNFTLVSYPAGLSIKAVTPWSPTRVVISLQFDGSDFDTTFHNFRVNIPSTVLVQTKSGSLSSTPLNIVHYIEKPVATLIADSVLTEKRLDFRVLTINLKEEKFRSYTTLQPSNFILVNRPTGLSVQSVTGISSTIALIALQFDGTDFDADSSNFYVNIPYTVLVQTISGYLSTSRLNIDAYLENPVATLTSDSILIEDRLDFRTLTLDLTEERFISYLGLQRSDFTLVNYPPGLSIESVNPVSPVKVQLALQFDGTDFEQDYSNFRVNISEAVLYQTTSEYLTSSPLTIHAVTENPTAILTADSILTEYRLDVRTLTIDLYEDYFTSYTTLKASDFNLINEPAGLSIQNVLGISQFKAYLSLQFAYTDFDTNFSDFRVDIDNSVLYQTTSGVLTSSPINIQAYVEHPEATLTSDTTVLTEPRLDARKLIINLSDEEFLDYTNLQASEFTLVNAPTGLSVQTVVGVSKTQALLDLQFDGTDFDENKTDFCVRISRNILLQSNESDLLSKTITIFAYVERPDAIMISDSLSEYHLDSDTLTINLVEETFINYATLSISDFVLNNKPTGLSIKSVHGFSPTKVILILAFTYNDFDNDISIFSVTIDKSKLYQSVYNNLTTNTLTIYAYKEVPVLLAEPDSVMHESTLGRRSLRLGLTEEHFLNYATLAVSNFSLVNAPTGLTIVSVNGINPDSAVLTLSYAGADFDNDITNLRVRISKSILQQSLTDLSSKNLITIYCKKENPKCTIKEDAELYELTLGGRYLDLTLTEEKFINYQTITLVNFELMNKPAGLKINSVIGNSPTSARITLTFDRTDFDVDYPNFSVKISKNILFQSITLKDLISDSLLITARIENPSAKITSDSLLYEYRLNYRTITLKLTDERFINEASVTPSKFTLENKPAGLSIRNINYFNEDSIRLNLNFTGTDFDDDITNFWISISKDILVQSPPNNLQTNTLKISANIEPIVTDVIISDKTMKSGDTVSAWIKVVNDWGVNYTLKSGTIGGYPLINFSKLSNNTYTAEFVITEKGNDYLASEDIPVYNLLLYNGNVPGVIHNQLIIQGNDLLDANPPIISLAWAGSSGKHNIGSTIEIRVTADGAEYNFDDASTINNIPFSSDNINIDTIAGTGNYKILYTIHEGDQNVNTGNLAIRILMHDIAGNTSKPFTKLESNDISIDAARPLIRRAYISSTDENVTVGESIDIKVVADQIGYTASPLTEVNGEVISSENFQDNNDSTYSFRYTVKEDDGRVFAGDLSINIILIDSYGNESQSFNSLDPNNVSVYTKIPSATLSGTTSICKNDSTPLTVTFGGTPPWEIELKIGSASKWISNITDTIWQYFVSPQTKTIYSINTVIDSTGNTNKGSYTAIITVNPLPVAFFSVADICILKNGGNVQFINTSDTSKGVSYTWKWNFDDPPSGINNTSTKKNPSHFYDSPQQKNVSLIVTNEKGCSDTAINLVTLRPIPEADFVWSSECLTSNAISFTGTEKLFADDSVSTREWKFYDASGSLANISVEKKPDYLYDSSKTYDVTYKVTTNYGCSDTIQKEITLYPTFNIAEGSYYQDFETQLAGWSAHTLSGTRNSWKWSSVSDTHFPYTASSGTMAWYTSLPQPEALENSAVISPCFSFENVARPLMMIDIKRSMDRDQEGVVVQYTYDNCKTWKNVGRVNNGGLNWYNSSRINNGPAGQSTGWTGAITGSEDTEWITAAHHLDDLINKKEVRFRIVYGSRGDNTIRNEGFAFDNFHICQRIKVAVMEYFTNANESKCVIPDNLVNSLANKLYKDIIDIQYHTSYPSADRMNLDNPTPASSRGLYYGVSSVPYALIDGDGYDAVLGHERSYNFSTRSPDSTDILVRALLNTDFHIGLEINQLTPVIQVTVTIKALKDIPLKELTLNTIVQEVLINDPLYTGTNGVNKFENVARMMLPDASGTTFKKSWSKGETKEVTITWNEPFDYLNEDNIAITVFLQDYNTKEIFQAAGYSPEERPTSSHGITGYAGPKVRIYPNPAKDYITIDLGEPPEESLLFRLYDLSGKCLLENQILPMQKETVLNLREFVPGLYIIEIRKKTSFEVKYNGKLAVY